MAAITLGIPVHTGHNTWRIRTGTAQADTGQTDWISVPSWATYATIRFNCTASAGSSPGPTLIHLKGVDPVALNDTNAQTLYTMTTGLANTGMITVEAGPGVSGIADVTSTAVRGIWNGVLPPVLGITTVLDRTNADETYTYTLSVTWRA